MFWILWLPAIFKDQINSYKMDKTLSVKIIDYTNLEIPSREHCRIGKINSHNGRLIEFHVHWAALVLARCQLPVVGTGNNHHGPVFEGFLFQWLTGAWRQGEATSWFYTEERGDHICISERCLRQRGRMSGKRKHPWVKGFHCGGPKITLHCCTLFMVH